MTEEEVFSMAVKCYLISPGNREGFYGDALIQFAKLVEEKAIKEALAEHAMRETQRLGQEIEQEPVWSDAGNLKLLKKGDVLRVFRKGQEHYRAFRFDGLLQECDYTYDGNAPFVWLEVGMATLGKIVYTRKDFTTGAVYADRGDRVELFQPAIKETLAQPEQIPPSADSNTHQPEQEPVAHSVIAGAIFDFMGWLTSRKERIVLSSADNASPAVEAITEFAKMRNLSLDDAKVQDWNTTPPQRTEQEPVAWMDADGNVSDNNDHKCFPIPLYTHPPQRTWVDVPDEEIKRLWIQYRAAMPRYLCFAKAIQAKLKEKNT